jgi:7-cyano-7-deazaguanine synthase
MMEPEMNGPQNKTVVMLSGGIDSTTLLAHAIYEKMRDPKGIIALSFDYGQKHRSEIEQAREIADYYGVEHHIIELRRGLFAGIGSSLIEGEMPQMTYEELSQSFGVSPTYVPFRNGTFLSFATVMALTHDADEVYYAPHAEDARGWAYPDCTPEFNGAMANAIYVGTYHKVRLVTPFQFLRKHEIISLGAKWGVPFQMTHSCYEGTRPACGKCPTCVARIAAFVEAGVRDPIEYDEAVPKVPA